MLFVLFGVGGACEAGHLAGPPSYWVYVECNYSDDTYIVGTIAPNGETSTNIIGTAASASLTELELAELNDLFRLVLDAGETFPDDLSREVTYYRVKTVKEQAPHGLDSRTATYFLQRGDILQSPATEALKDRIEALCSSWRASVR